MSKSVCSHLDAELNGRYHRSPYKNKTVPLDAALASSFMPKAEIHGVRKGDSAVDKAEAEGNMNRFLNLYRVDKMDKDILISKFVYDYTYEQLSEEFGFTGPVSAWRYVRHLMEKMKMKIKAGPPRE